jgi:hypothetical protein
MFNKLMMISLPILSLAILSGCAAGAATAGYAIKAQSADSLTASAEQKIIDRAKREIMADMAGNSSCISRSHQDPHTK